MPHQGSAVATRPQTIARPRAKRKGRIKSSAIAVYASVFTLLIAFIAVGYQPPQKVSPVAGAAVEPTANVVTDQPTVNDVVATTIASNVAQASNLSIATNVANLSVSTQVKNELAQSDEAVIEKPQIVQPTAANRDIESYTTVAGDTVPALAAKYAISPETIKWANNITSDNLTTGKVLQILPTNGVLYTVKAGDTVQAIADKYKADVARVTLYNDLETNALNPGAKIILPNGVLPNTERPGYVAPVTYRQSTATTNFAAGSSGGAVKFLYRNTKPTTAGNTNAWGNCTWYAWERRLEIGKPLPSRALGNAAEWAYTLRASGYTVVYGAPQVGAIMQNGGGLGHVAIVETIAENGDVTVSEMNYGGWYNGVSQRTITAGQAKSYNYIY